MYQGSRNGVRRFLACLVVLGGLLMNVVAAQGFPNRPMTLVVPFAAGGGIDVVARQIATRLTAELGQSVVVENTAGAFGTIGAMKVARATADGHTLLFVVSSPLNVAPLVNPEAVRYDTFKDFTPISTVGLLPFALIGRNGLDADSVAALLNLAKTQPVKLNFGTDGTGSLLHITGEYIQQRGGIALLHVPYKSAPQALTDVTGGILDLAILPVALVQPLVQEGKVRGYAVTSAERAPILPQVPALSETPGFEDVALESWMGLLAPSNLPPDVAQRLVDAMRRVAADPTLTAQLEARGIKPRVISSDAFSALLRDERQRIADVLRRMGN